MDKLIAIESDKVGDLYFACYVYQDEKGRVRRENLEPPNVSQWLVKGVARRQAQVSNVTWNDLIDLKAEVPLVESLAMMKRG